MCQCGGRGYYSRFPPGHFPAEERRRPCEANTDTVYFPESFKPSVARHKVKVKESNLLYRFTQLGATAPQHMAPACRWHGDMPLPAHATWRIMLRIHISAAYESWLWQMSMRGEVAPLFFFLFLWQSSAHPVFFLEVPRKINFFLSFDIYRRLWTYGFAKILSSVSNTIATAAVFINVYPAISTSHVSNLPPCANNQLSYKGTIKFFSDRKSEYDNNSGRRDRPTHEAAADKLPSHVSKVSGFTAAGGKITSEGVVIGRAGAVRMTYRSTVRKPEGTPPNSSLAVASCKKEVWLDADSENRPFSGCRRCQTAL